VQIANEKAGIIKQNVPIVISESQSAEIKNVFVNKAKKANAPIFFADKIYVIKNHSQKNLNGRSFLQVDIYYNNKLIYKGFRSELSGLYQQKNISGVLVAIDVLRKAGYDVSSANLFQGMLKVVKQTGLMGRWQVLSRKPLTIADTGHNTAGIAEVLKQINTTSFNKLHFVLGMVNDKDIKGVLNLLPKTAAYYFCKPSIPRGLDETHLKQVATSVGLKGISYKSVKVAVKAARRAALKNDMVFIGGSTFVVAEAL